MCVCVHLLYVGTVGYFLMRIVADIDDTRSDLDRFI